MMEQRLTFADLLELKQIGEVVLDPAGERVAYTVAESALGVGEPAAASRIWIAPLEGEPYQATQGPGTDDMPRWSPDGQTLAFRSDRVQRGVGQIYVLGQGWSEPHLLHAFPAGVDLYAWSPDGSAIAVIAADPQPERAPGADEVEFEDAAPCSRLWMVDMRSGRARQVTHGRLHLWELCWAPDGGSIAAIVSERPLRWSWYGARLARIDLDSGEVTDLYAPDRQLARPAWSPDGRSVAVVVSTWSDPGMTGGDVVLVPVDGGEPRSLTAGEQRSHLSLHWRPDGRSLLTSALERGQAAVCELALHGGSETLWRGDRSFVSYEMSTDRSGRLVAAALSGFQQPTEVMVGTVDGDLCWRPLSHLNQAFAGSVAGSIEEVEWRAPDGISVSGLLVLPKGRSTGLPLVTLIHGGPTGIATHVFPGGGIVAWIPALLQRGVAVFMPNFRGSAGWGLEFAEANHSDMGGADLQDVLSGIDALVERGTVDPERLAVGGWSYGGYLTAWVVTQTTRFKAAIAGASITNWLSFHGTTDIPAFDARFYEANPYDPAGIYADRSPIFFADRVRTPTLFLHGERDHTCPPGQAIEFFRALRSCGVETRCVIYPREGHPIRERVHRLDMLERGLEWFCRHLGV